MTTLTCRAIARGCLSVALAAAVLTPAPASAGRQEARGSISGRVTARRDGRPLRGASVSLSSLASSDTRVTATDESGRFRFSDVVAGAYILRAGAKGFCSLEWGEDGDSFPGGLPVVIDPRQAFDKADLSLPDGSAIAGTVVDALQDPVDSVPVHALRVEYSGGKRLLMPVPGRPTITDDRGRYRLFGLQPGTYYVAAAPGALSAGERAGDELPGYALTYFPAAPDVASAEAINIRAGGETHAADITLVGRRMQTLSGVALDADGSPASRAEIILTPGPDADIAVAAQVVTSASGAFSFPNLPAGTYLVQMLPTPAAPLFAVETVTLQDTVSGLTLRGRRSRAVRGTIEFDGDAPMLPPGALDVRLRSVDFTRSPIARGARVRVERDRTFAIDNVWGAHVLTVNAPEGWAVKAVTIGADDFTGEAIDFDRMAPADTIRVVLTDRLRPVSGVVASARGIVSAHTPVILFGADPQRATSPYVRRITTDAQGRFAFTAVPAGDYCLVALDRVRREMLDDPRFLDALRTEAMRVSVSGHDQKTVNLEPLPSRRIPF